MNKNKSLSAKDERNSIEKNVCIVYNPKTTTASQEKNPEKRNEEKRRDEKECYDR